MKVVLNVNDTVKVKLTDRGKSVIRRKGFQCPDEDSVGYSKWQLWDLFQTFEGHIGLGKELPFNADIILHDD